MVLYKRSALKNVSQFTDKHKRQPSGGALSKEKMFLKIQPKWQQNSLFQNSQSQQSLFFNKVAGWKPGTFRSSHWRCSVKQGALENFANFTGNKLCWSLFLIKFDIWCLQLNQRRLRHRWFPVRFAIIFKKICACLLVKFIQRETPK